MISGFPVIEAKSVDSPSGVDHQATSLVPGLDEVIEQIRPLPPNSALLGVCEDEVPLILDLNNPSPGAILAIGDNRFGNQQFLRSLLLSASMLNDQQDINIHLVSPNARAYPHLTRQPHFIQAFNSHEMASWVLVEEFVRLGRERQKGVKAYPMQVLAIDEIDLLVQDFEDELITGFQWLIEAGPELNIWVVATLSSNHVRRELKPFLKLFGTKVYGRIESPIVSAQLAGRPFLDLSNHFPGVECTIRSAGEDIDILIPQVTDSFNPTRNKNPSLEE